MATVQRGDVCVKLQPQQFRVLAVLLEFGDRIGVPSLIDALYGHRTDGGPLFAGTIVQMYVHQLRPLLAPLGIGIDAVYRRGYRATILPAPFTHQSLRKAA